MSERETSRCDVLVVGAGMAGASLAAELAPHRRVILLERESQPGYHSTGRSAALFSEAYGPAPIRALSAASRNFLFRPPAGFADGALVRPRGHLVFGRPGQEAELDALAEDFRLHAARVDRLSGPDTVERVPALCPWTVGGGVFEHGAADIDVHALHQGYLRLVRAFGGDLVCDHRLEGLSRDGGGWRADLRCRVIAADVVVDAAGAWADEVAARAGATPVGLVPKRRTALTVDLAAPIDADGWPMTGDLDETVYFKPDAGRLLVSPSDATPVAPCDVQPEEFDIATAIDRLETLTAMKVKRVAGRWAGLRTFAPDGLPVIGWDAGRPGGAPDFFWLAGQGGYGIQAGPAMARMAAAILLGRALPQDLVDRGLGEDILSPSRFAGAPVPAAVEV